MNKEKNEQHYLVYEKALILFGILGILLFCFVSITAAPEGPTGLSSISNETKSASSAITWNISGGYISTFNLTAATQNPRWKGFVGNVTGRFTLNDASGATLFDWSLSSVSGNVYSTRNDSTINWGSIVCANTTHLNTENNILHHNNSQDNLSATFSVPNGTHDSFFVGTTFFSANSCPTLNTYVNNVTQDSSFEEMALYSTPSIIYANIMETDIIGFDGNRYDFQAIVPENGSIGWSGATAYYLYIELT